jgi:hypothetical protein
VRGYGRGERAAAGAGSVAGGDQKRVLAADGKFTVPVAGTFPLEDWRTAMEISLTGQASGKLMLLP